MIRKQGICPFCGSKIIIYGVTYWDEDNVIVQECNCDTCGKAFDEVYNAKYDHTETDEDE